VVFFDARERRAGLPMGSIVCMRPKRLAAVRSWPMCGKARVVMRCFIRSVPTLSPGTGVCACPESDAPRNTAAIRTIRVGLIRLSWHAHEASSRPNENRYQGIAQGDACAGDAAPYDEWISRTALSFSSSTRV